MAFYIRCIRCVIFTQTDFIAHEVRNPLSASISACTFLEATLKGKEKLSEEDHREVEEDLSIIDSSLKFSADLLRSMLDVHRASNKQMELEYEPVDILSDIFVPVSVLVRIEYVCLYGFVDCIESFFVCNTLGISQSRGWFAYTRSFQIYMRDKNFEFLTECNPRDLCIHGDKLRLEQIMLNLARNASKFVDEGFVRLRAEVVDGSVRLICEDSGPGIPPEKVPLLFNKFQSSLDCVAQGTGVGLNLCKALVDLMGGEIFLDESYTSGFKSNKGTRIVVDLRSAPLVVLPRHEERTTIDMKKASSVLSSHKSSCCSELSSSILSSQKSTACSEEDTKDDTSVTDHSTCYYLRNK